MSARYDKFTENSKQSHYITIPGPEDPLLSLPSTTSVNSKDDDRSFSKSYQNLKDANQSSPRSSRSSKDDNRRTSKSSHSSTGPRKDSTVIRMSGQGSRSSNEEENVQPASPKFKPKDNRDAHSFSQSSRRSVMFDDMPSKGKSPSTTTLVSEELLLIEPFKKLFIQRDYSQGVGARFLTNFPSELENIIEAEVFFETLDRINEILAEGEKLQCKTFCEGLMGCLTGYLIWMCFDSYYEKCLKELQIYIKDQNERVWVPKGVHITDPQERALRSIEITIFNTKKTRSKRTRAKKNSL